MVSIEPNITVGWVLVPWEVQLCNRISLVDHVYKPWPNQENMMFIVLFNV